MTWTLVLLLHGHAYPMRVYETKRECEDAYRVTIDRAHFSPDNEIPDYDCEGHFSQLSTK